MKKNSSTAPDSGSIPYCFYFGLSTLDMERAPDLFAIQ